ncbi:hypothetical protein C0J52_27483 [Blattella germanica]|nr:hypothetical protein C0J52_27483 [Blattella germanica]
MQQTAICKTVGGCALKDTGYYDSIVSKTIVRPGRIDTRGVDSKLQAPGISNSSPSVPSTSQMDSEDSMKVNNSDLANEITISVKIEEAPFCSGSAKKIKLKNLDSTRRLCSRCSSILSMDDFFESADAPVLFCKLCLGDVPFNKAIEIAHCGCSFCDECIIMYLKFKIQEGAYEISCPDAQCKKQGVISLWEIESLVSEELMKQHKNFRFNREVDLDATRMWCPRAGCGTVCNACESIQQNFPQKIQCPTCSLQFCSSCKNPWHAGLTCKDNSKRLSEEGQLDLIETFDPDVIKRCPVCSVPIERSDGCAQIMCKQCNHLFCWYCLTSLDNDFFLRHFDRGSCKNKLGHSRISTAWYRVQVATMFAGFGILVLLASPCFLLTIPCLIFKKCINCRERSNE